MKNNKLLKRLLMSSALGAISLGGAVDILAFDQTTMNAIVPNADIDLAAGGNLADNQTLDIGLVAGGGGVVVGGSREGITYGGLDIKAVNGTTFRIGAEESLTDPVNGASFRFGAITRTVGANNTVSFSAANNSQLFFDQATTDCINKITGGAKNFVVTFANTSTVKEVSGVNTTIIANGANADLTLANTKNFTHSAKIFKTDGDDQARLTISGKSKAGIGAGEGYVATQGTLTIGNDSEGRYEATVANSQIFFDASNNDITAKGDAVLKHDDAKLVFTNKGYVAQAGVNTVGETRNTSFIGKIEANAAGNGQIIVSAANFANNVLNLTLEENIGANGSAIGLIEVSSAGLGRANLTLTGNSFVNNYKYDANSTLVLDSRKGDVTHKGIFGSANPTGTLKTTGANNVILDGNVLQGKLVVGTASGKMTSVTGNIGSNAVAAVEFDSTIKGGYLQAKEFQNNSTVDFKGTGSTVIVAQGTVTFAPNTDVSGSTVKLSSANQNLILTQAGKAGELLNVDASAITQAANGVQVANGSFFDVIDTGAGKLNHNGVATISAKKVKGAEITVGANGFTINMLEKDAIESRKINFTADAPFTINGYNGDFGTFISEVTSNGNNGARALNLNGSGTISSEKIGTAVNVLNVLNIAQTNGEVATFNIANPNHQHNIAGINVGVGTARFASAYNNNGNLVVVSNGTVDLTSEGPDGVRVGNVVTLSGTGSFNANAATQLKVTDGSQLKLVDADNEAFNVVLDSGAYGDDNGKVLIINNATGQNLATLQAGTATISPDQNLFATDKLEYVNDAGAVVANGGFTKGYSVRSIDSKKLENFVKAQNFTGDLKAVSDSIAQVGDKATGALRKFDILAGSDKNRAAANLASALPRNVIDIQKNIYRTQSLIGVTRSAASAAADDLKSSAGLWVKGSFGKGSQQVSDIASSSYDSTLWGGTAGAEFNLGESVTVGAAGSYSKTTLEYKGLRQGDKDVFKSILGSVYGFATFSNNIVLNATLVAGNTDVEGTTTSVNGKSSKDDDKISAIAYSGTMLGGYKFSGSSFSVTPLAGLSFANFTDPARKTAYGFASVKKSDLTRVDLIGGVSIAGEINAADMVVVPELHGFVHYNLKGDKNQKTLDFNGGQSISYMGSDTTKTNFLLGGAITAKSGMVEYGASVDGQFADKYWGVLGSLKLKVNL